jgi:hypothetical protein
MSPAQGTIMPFGSASRSNRSSSLAAADGVGYRDGGSEVFGKCGRADVGRGDVSLPASPAESWASFVAAVKDGVFPSP